MDEPEPQFLEVGGNGAAKRRRIAYRRDAAKRKDAVELIWLPGFLSDMASTKATAVAEWAAAQGFAMTRFDYSAHGRSGGTLLEATVGDWLEETVAVWHLMGPGPRIVIGSSMGGWIALLLARHLASARNERRPCRPGPDRAGLRHDRSADVGRAAAGGARRDRDQGRDLCAVRIRRALSRSPGA